MFEPMQALNPGRVIALSLLITMPWFATAAETGSADGEWKCAQATDTGKWSCSRDGMSATELAAPSAGTSPATAPAAVNAEVDTEATPVAGAATAPAQIDPYEARARAARETVVEPVVAEAPDATELVDEPVAAAPTPATADVTPGPEPVTLPELEPAPDSEAEAEPAQQSTATETANLPDFQRLAYVPDKPTSLLELPPNFWVAQLMAVSSKEFLESYAEEHNLRGLSAARIASGERLFFVLILGIYETKQNAEQAITDMPPPYHKYKPLLRTLGSLQDAMRKADSMTGSSDF